MSLNFCSVSHTLRKTVPHTPDGVTGLVRFTPIMPPGDAWQVTDNGDTVTVPAVPVTAQIVDGDLGPVEVFAAGDNSNPAIAMWRVEYVSLRVGGLSVRLDPVLFKAVPGGVVDLAEVYPVSGATPVGITRGEKGDAFTFDDFTPEQLAIIKGEKGDPFTYEDFTPAQIADLKGEKGDTGLTPTLTAGSATTLPAGAAPTVGITGTKENPVLNIGVPLPTRTGRTLIYTGTGTPLLSNFPDAQIGDYIVRKSDGQEWRVDP